MIVAVILVAALLQWLFFFGRLVITRDSEQQTHFLVSTMAMALIWLSVAALWSGERRAARAAGQVTRGGCSPIRDGMKLSDMRAAMGEPSQKVSETDNRGPGAEAWVYRDAGCIAHVVFDRVRSVDIQ